MMYSSEDMCQDMTSEFAEKLSDLKGHGFSRALEFVQFLQAAEPAKLATYL